jgi:hypothetical protein
MRTVEKEEGGNETGMVLYVIFFFTLDTGNEKRVLSNKKRLNFCFFLNHRYETMP